MHSHGLVGQTDEDAVGIVAYMLLKGSELALQKPGEVALVFSLHRLVQLWTLAGNAQVVEHGRLEGWVGFLHTVEVLVHALVGFLGSLVVQTYQGREHDVKVILVYLAIVFQHHLLDFLWIVLLLEVVALYDSIDDATCVSLEETSYETCHSLIAVYSFLHLFEYLEFVALFLKPFYSLRKGSLQFVYALQ